MQESVILYTTWPDAETAEAAAAEAIALRLAACANILAPMRAIYRWQGAVERAGETPVLFKTTATAASALTAWLVENHPYETPCVVAVRIDTAGSSGEFLEWIAAEVSAPESQITT